MTSEAQLVARGHEPPAQPVWLISFADLISLLLCFFVMIFAMSSIELARWQQIVKSVGTTNVVNPPNAEAKPAVVEPRPRRPGRSALGATANNGVELDYLAAILEQRIADDGELDGATVTRLGDSLAIAGSRPAFASGRSELSDDAKPFFVGLGRVLGNLRNQVDVRGSGESWALAIGRATAIAAELKRGGYLPEPSVLGAGAASELGDAAVVVRPWRPETQVRVR